MVLELIFNPDVRICLAWHGVYVCLNLQFHGTWRKHYISIMNDYDISYQIKEKVFYVIYVRTPFNHVNKF